jgi:hypothetical protein
LSNLKVKVGIIHNFEANRQSSLNDALKITLEALHNPISAVNLNSSANSYILLGSDQIIEASKQDDFELNRISIIPPTVNQFRIYVRSAFLRYGLSLNFIKHVKSEFRLSTFPRIVSRSEKVQRACHWDHQVTKKHVAIFEEFLRSNSEVLIVFESDVIASKETKVLLLRVFLDFLKIQDQNKVGIYVDLAGGFKISDILGKRVTETHQFGESLAGFSANFVNTNCAYLVNRQLAEEFVSFVHSHPGLEMISIDALFNHFLRATSKRVLVAHPINLPFGHGSQLGLF